MSWTQRMNRALEYIETNLDGDLCLDDVAAVTSCSKFHFHRMFYAAFDVTYAEYVRRRRLTKAAVDIENETTRIVDIAVRYGYDSHNAFTRAFRSVHGINPSDVRKTPSKLASYKRLTFPNYKTGKVQMDYQIVERPEFKLIGKSKEFVFDDFVKHGRQFWKEYVRTQHYRDLYQYSNGRSGKVSSAPLMSAYFAKDNSSHDEFIDVLGIEMEQDRDASDYSVYTIPPATYAEFYCTYLSSMKTNRYIYGEWFASTGYQRDESKPDIAAYLPIAFRPMGEMIVRWWIPVVPRVVK